jgi:thiamine biosynthesis lipoprotein
MKRWSPWLVAGALITAVACWFIGRDDDRYASFEGGAFATRYCITYLRGADPEAVREAVDAELDRLDWIASSWKPESELMRYDRCSDKSAFELSADLTYLLELSREIEQWTDGAFSIRFDPRRLELSAIAKGYAVDCVVELLHEKFGIDHCLVDIGGEIKARGHGPGGRGWRVGIYAPGDGGGIPTPKLELHDNSIATSGTYFKGEHIIDPKSGRRAGHDLISTSVIHPSAATADALATALCVMGPEDGMAWVQKNDIHAIFLLKDGTRREHQPFQSTNPSARSSSPDDFKPSSRNSAVGHR